MDLSICTLEHREDRARSGRSRWKAMVFLAAWGMIVLFGGFEALPSKAYPCFSASCVRPRRGAADTLKAPKPEDEGPHLTQGTILVDHSLIIYVCDFKLFLRINFFPMPEGQR